MRPEYQRALRALRDMMEALGESRGVILCDLATVGHARAQAYCGFAVATALRQVRIGHGGENASDDATPRLLMPQGTPHG